MEYLLSTENLTKQYGRKKAVDNVSIHVRQGAVYGLIGRNGAGKTTLMKMLSGLAAPSAGSFSLFGEEGAKAGKIMNRVGALIEEPGVYADMSAYGNLHAKCIALGVRNQDTERELLEIVGLTDTGKKPVGKFSLGMKQRLGIALALVGTPDLVILDEPINGLDPQGIAEVRNTIERLNRERRITFIISSHILGELSKFASDYGIIHNGQLLQELTREQLLEKCSRRIVLNTPDTPAASTVLEKIGITNYRVTAKDTLEIYERLSDTAEINSALASAGIPINGISISNQELEDYFLELTGGGKNV
ncbi:MAG: ATP-binding cassette domain-containing protein [Butyrivibrio sp.]|nr:ATP-binding cassette domain-containing protein [Acetatifactor muris]MCM1560624.1 ATP-binding cassette domain-containing protein [Butyrivibrio sp.]